MSLRASLLWSFSCFLVACGAPSGPDGGSTGGGSATGGGAATGGGTATGGGSATGGGGGSASLPWLALWDGGAPLDGGDLSTFVHPHDVLGQRVSGWCPVGFTLGSAWGTDLYTDDSPVCTAAVHMGLLTVATGGVVTFELRPGAMAYVGSTRFGVTTENYGVWDGSLVFVGVDGGLLGNVP